MGSQLNFNAASYLAGNQDFSAIAQPRFVKLDATSRVVLATANSNIEGILENCPPIGSPAVCTVSYSGITKLAVDAAYIAGTKLGSDATGIGTTAGVDGTCARAIVIEPSDSSAGAGVYEIVTVRLIDQPSY
jgi:hypothetical protein